MLRCETNCNRWPYTADFLASFGVRVRDSGRRFLVVLVRTKEQVLDGHIETFMEQTGATLDEINLFGFRDHMLRTRREGSIEVLDLTPVFDHPHMGTTANYYFGGDGHWNAAGH